MKYTSACPRALNAEETRSDQIWLVSFSLRTAACCSSYILLSCLARTIQKKKNSGGKRSNRLMRIHDAHSRMLFAKLLSPPTSLEPPSSSSMFLLRFDFSLDSGEWVAFYWVGLPRKSFMMVHVHCWTHQLAGQVESSRAFMSSVHQDTRTGRNIFGGNGHSNKISTIQKVGFVWVGSCVCIGIGDFRYFPFHLHSEAVRPQGFMTIACSSSSLLPCLQLPSVP